MDGSLTALLGCAIPLQLAPMGCATATPALPLAVARAGGHAMYPALGLPPAALAPVVEAIARETRAFGVNFLVPLMHADALDAVAGVAPYVDFFLGAPDPALVGRAHAGGAVCGWQVETGEDARAAEAAGCDVVIAKGSESGGRKGIDGLGLLPLLDAVLGAVSIPVLAAGGIATARGVAAAHAAGASGVRVGTRFIATEESDAHPAWKAALVDAAGDEAIVTDAFNVGMPVPGPHRVLRRSVAAAEALRDEQAGVVRLAGAAIPAARFGPMAPTAGSTGAIDAMPFYAGQSTGAIRSILPAGEVVAALQLPRSA